ncbi:indole-3-glycerol phosphate synthase TrpC [Weeksellaceae bacterium KMM 9724]|uniref:indole-3-glycerol phosphate synthase TrpC n=1 Tax=Profundicola chukchiensis TaxID=2961959 RepID=UPI0024397752|nr:indole-3-glycerol phosphate synthase TrpC [Profundicola chukchiensis]MDG4950185.1 indole-3-glycerol phosphate synthase TrpC [Profundicola chukchiensis]
MINILNEIAQHKLREVSEVKSKVPLGKLQQLPFYNRTCLSAKQSMAQSQNGIIAEFKRKSPSQPNINLDAKVEQVAIDYSDNGAAAISILTDQKYFGGSFNFLEQARENDTPLLCKEFIIDSYQIHQAKAHGADFILLIAALLSKAQILEFTKIAKDLGLEVLLEFHAGEEFEKLINEVDLVGINNRDLKTFEVDLQHSIAMRNRLPEDRIVIAESGIHSVEDYKLLKQNGFDGFLIGEYFMKQEKPGQALKQFIQSINEN